MQIEQLLIALERKMYGPQAGNAGAIGLIVFYDKSGFIMDFGNDHEKPVGTLGQFNSPDECYYLLLSLVEN